MEFEELRLGSESIHQRFIALNILLRSVDNANKPELQRVDPPGEDFQSVGAMIHQIQFGQHTNGPFSLRINLASELESFRVHKVDIGWRDCQDNTVRFGNILANQVLGLFLNVCWLVADWYLKFPETLDTAPPESTS